MTEKNSYLKQLSYIIEKEELYSNELNKLFKAKISNIVLVGCGATLSQMYVLQYLLEQHITTPTRIINSAEVVGRKAKTINNRTLVIVSSHSGSTKETIEAARVAKDQGSVVLAISANKESNLAKSADYTLVYPNEGTAPSEAKLLLLLLAGILLVKKDGEAYENLITDWRKLPETLWTVRNEAKSASVDFVAKFADKKMFYILASGTAYGAAYAFSICKFMEMQWLDACALQSGEFFHGPVEKVDSNTNYILLKAEDLTSPLTDRVARFLEKQDTNYYVIDTKDYELKNISKENREFFAVLALWPIMNSYMEMFSQETGHSLDKRRYMGKVDY